MQAPTSTALCSGRAIFSKKRRPEIGHRITSEAMVRKVVIGTVSQMSTSKPGNADVGQPGEADGTVRWRKMRECFMEWLQERNFCRHDGYANAPQTERSNRQR